MEILLQLLQDYLEESLYQIKKNIKQEDNKFIRQNQQMMNQILLIITVSLYKKRKLTDHQKILIKSYQQIYQQEKPKQSDSNTYKRIQTVLEQLKQERFKKIGLHRQFFTFDSIEYAQNKEYFRQNKQNQDFSSTSQNQNCYNDDQKSDLHNSNNPIKKKLILNQQTKISVKQYSQYLLLNN